MKFFVNAGSFSKKKLYISTPFFSFFYTFSRKSTKNNKSKYRLQASR